VLFGETCAKDIGGGAMELAFPELRVGAVSAVGSGAAPILDPFFETAKEKEEEKKTTKKKHEKRLNKIAAALANVEFLQQAIREMRDKAVKSGYLPPECKQNNTIFS